MSTFSLGKTCLRVCFTSWKTRDRAKNSVALFNHPFRDVGVSTRKVSVRGLPEAFLHGGEISPFIHNCLTRMCSYPKEGNSTLFFDAHPASNVTRRRGTRSLAIFVRFTFKLRHSDVQKKCFPACPDFIAILVGHRLFFLRTFLMATPST